MNKKIISIVTAAALSTMMVNLTPLLAQSNNPVPVITSISPDTTYAGSSTMTLTVNGSNFVSNSSVLFNGNFKATYYVSPTQLTATILTSDLSAAGTYSVMVSNPTPGGGNSNTMSFTVLASNSTPFITSISPVQVNAGGSSFTLTVNGSNFVASNTPSVVRVNGSDRSTTFISTVQLMATVLASDISAAGTRNITVYNAGPNNMGTSNTATLTVNPLGAPAITSISPSVKIVGSSGFFLTVNGSGFNANSVVNFNGSARATTYASPNALSAVILASDLDTVSVNSITVNNPGQGTSNAASFTVTAVPGLPNTGIGPGPNDPVPPQQPKPPTGNMEFMITLGALFTLPIMFALLKNRGKKYNV